MANNKPNPYKGHPKAEWPAIKASLAAEKQYTEAPMPDPVPNSFAAESPVELPPQAPAPPRINSEPEAPTHIPRNLFNGTMKTLDVLGKNGSTDDPIPGFRLYWFNDPGNTGVRPSQAKMSGWEFVDRDEVLLTENLVGNNDLGSKVSKIVEPNLVPPTRAYLMKKPKWLDEAHQAEREELHQKQEGALRSGTLGRKPENRQYSPQEMRGQTSLPPIEISSNVFRK